MAKMLPSGSAKVAPAPINDGSDSAKQEEHFLGSPPEILQPKCHVPGKVGSKPVNDKVSCFAELAYHPTFENTTMFVIVCNAFWIGIDTQWNHERLKVDGVLPLEPASIVIENLFCTYFSIELFIRFFAFREKRECFFDAWFVFDSVLVACMIFETWVMVIVVAAIGGGEGGIGPLSALRLLRLLRLARMGRLMKFVPEMGKLVKGMVKAARSVVFILIFLVLVIYVFAIIFTGTLSDREKYPLTPYCTAEEEAGLNASDGCVEDGEYGETAQDLCATMGDTAMTLFTRGVLGDNLDETVDAIMGASLILMWLFFIFIIITFATLLNMLIGVVCEVISDSAAEEEESATVDLLRGTIMDAFEEIDTNQDGLVSSREWNHIKDNKNVRKSFACIGIEDERMEERLQQMQEMLFEDNEEEGPSYSEGSHGRKEETPKPGELKRSNSQGTSDTDRNGLTVQELIQKVVDIRPDQNASALDLELLKAQVSKDQKFFKNKLKKFEDGLRRVVGPGRQSGGGGGGGGGKMASGMPPSPGSDLPALPDMNMSNLRPVNSSGAYNDQNLTLKEREANQIWG